MESKIFDGVMRIHLPAECTITCVEVDTDSMRAWPEGLTKVEVHGEAVTEIDTAYFQMLLALKNEAEQRGIPIIFQESPAIREICTLHGMALGGG